MKHLWLGLTAFFLVAFGIFVPKSQAVPTQPKSAMAATAQTCSLATGFVLPVIDDNPNDELTWSVPFNYFGHYYGALGGYHPGEDWNLVGGNGSEDLDQPVYAVADGIVEKISNLGSLGYLVALKHTGNFTIPAKNGHENGQNYSYAAETVNTIYSVYIHINKTPSLQVGACVSKGVTVLGRIMNPGGGPHLHFEIRHPDTIHSNDWSLFGTSSNWAKVGGAYTGYYLNLQGMVNVNVQVPGAINGGVRDPRAFITANNIACSNGTSTLRNRDGGPPIHPPGSVIKTASNLTVYLIDSENRKRPLSPSALSQLYNQSTDARTSTNFNNWVIIVGQDELDLYESGGSIFNALPGNGKPFPDGKLISYNGEVSIVTGGGKRRPFVTANTFTGLGFNFCQVVNVSQAEYNSYSVGPPVDAMPMLTSSLNLSPAGPYTVGQSITGSFTIKNVGYQPITFSSLGIGGRLNGATVHDMNFVSTTLAAGSSYTYGSQPRQLTGLGTYDFFAAYQESNAHWAVSVPAAPGIIRSRQLTVSPGTQPPSAPTANAATNISNNSFTANWSSSTGAAGYRLDVSTNSSFSGYVPGYQDVDVGNVLSRSVSGLSANTTYYYRVRAYNTGGTSSNSNSIPVTMPSSNIQITIQTNPSGRTFTVDGSTYNSAQTFLWTPGSSHTISTTSPQSGGMDTQYVWGSWSDGGATSHTITPNSSTTYTANFTTQYFLTMNAGAGGTVSPASGWFNSGQSVTITATPNSGSNFTGWTGTGSGSITGTSNPTTVVMNGPITETANFGTQSFQLTVSKAGSGSGTVTSNTGAINCGGSCQATLNSGTQVTLTATPASGSTLTGWSGACSGAGTCTLTMDSSKTVTATFQSPTPNYQLTVNKTGSGSGTVTSNTGAINCGGTCSASLISAAQITLTAAPASGSTFTGWSGDCSGTGTCALTMNSHKSATATFNNSGQCQGAGQRILPNGYVPGQLLNVSIQVSPPSTTNVYLVEEKQPQGWAVSGINNSGEFDSTSGKIKWLFLDAQSRTLGYSVTPPVTASGTQTFTGSLILDETPQALCGNSSVSPATYHPADTNNNFRIEALEIASYGTAWKKGTIWSRPPNPIPPTYVANAGVIWKKGEAYHYDPSKTPPWSQGSSFQTAAVQNSPLNDTVSGIVAGGTAISSFSHPTYTPGVGLVVTLAITPDSSTVSQVIEETLPIGWTVSSVSDQGEFDNVSGKVRWLFFDNNQRTLTYTVVPPLGETGSKAFNGIVIFDETQIPIGGARTISQTVITNSPPMISPVAVSRQQGSPASNSTIANVSDANQAANTLTVMVNSSSIATVNGVTVSGISVNAAGVVTANVMAACNATNAAFTLTVTDSGGASANATLNVTVINNTPPVLTYSNQTVAAGGSLTINPATSPSDNGSISSIVVQSQGSYTGTISVNSSTGVISISGAKPSGTHTITIRATDNCGAPTNVKFTLVVNIPNSTTSVVSSLNPSVFGQSVTFTATVAASTPATGTTSGTVTFKDGATTLCTSTLNGSGIATCATDTLTVGSHLITAVYIGDINFNGSTSSTLSQTVNKASTGVIVTSSRNPSVEGEQVTFSAMISAVAPGKGTPTGTITFKSGTTTICSSNLNVAGRADCNNSSLSVGNHQITAAYNGDGNFTASVSPMLQQTVSPKRVDLAIAMSASPGTISNSTKITYNITVTNKGPGNATQVVVTDNLPASVSFVSCSATNGGVCGGTGNNRTVTFASLAQGTSATIKLEVTANCANVSIGGISNTVSVSSAIPDQNPGDNSATAIVNAAPGQAKLTLGNGGGSFDFGSVTINREPGLFPPTNTFIIENTGCLPLIAGLSVNRAGADVSSGKIANSDDSATFPLTLINSNGTEIPLTFFGGSSQFQINGGQQQRFRIAFNPMIPAPAGGVSNLSAGHVLPPFITSALTIRQDNGIQTTVPLVGRISTAARMINPLATRLSPLVALARSGVEVVAEFSVFDSNLDSYLAVYQFLDSLNRPIGDALNFDLDQPIRQSGMLMGQSFTVVKRFTGAAALPQVNKVRVTLYDREGNESVLSGEIGKVIGRVVNVSAASFLEAGLASEAITSAFGTNLTVSTQVATSAQLPTLLAGTRVFVRDSANVERLAPLFFIAPSQINYQIPMGTSAGPATVTVALNDQAMATATAQIAMAAPSLFAANANGQGVAAAVALRVRPDGTQIYEPISVFDQTQNRFVSRPISMGADNEQVYLVLFGTGIRHRSALSNVSVTIGGVNATVEYAGLQNGFVGLDQVNIRLPRALAGRGEVDIMLTVDGKQSNIVKFNVH
ncbi:MAG: Ig-like domain repeat protein [Acidobacteria bacterium]|nr:Ig-like domain repeat protein [Acidobacteriota bacterium]